MTSPIKISTRTYSAADDTFLSTGKAYTSDQTTLSIATDAGTATFQASDGLFAHNITISPATGADLSSLTFSVVGVKIDGVVATEAITGGNAVAASGNVLFKSISAVNTTGGPTANFSVQVGIGRKFGLPPCRIKGFHVYAATDAGTLQIRDSNLATGERLAHWDFPAAPTTGVRHIDVTLPADGLRVPGGAHVAFNSGLQSVTLYWA